MSQLPLLSTRTTPRTRGDCEEGERPCPHTACRYHLWADDERPGRPWHGQRPPPVVRAHSPQTCALDVAADQGQRDKRGRLSLDAVGEMLGITGQRVHQLQMRAVEKLKAHGLDLGVDGHDADVDEDDEVEALPARKRVRLPIVGAGQLKLLL